MIPRALTCQFCDQVYWAFTRPELDAFEKMSKALQDKFDTDKLEAHKKVCFNKEMYGNAGTKAPVKGK